MLERRTSARPCYHMDMIRDIVSEIEKALGSDATPEQVESLAILVLERLGGAVSGDCMTAEPRSQSQSLRSYGIVTACGPNGRGILAILSNVLADSGAVIEEVSQTVRDGVFVLAVRIELTAVAIPVMELRKRLQAAAAAQNVRVSVHRADLHAAMRNL